MKADDIFVPTSVLESWTERQRQPGKSYAGTRNPDDEKPKKGSGGKDRAKKREIKK
jgi:hypothetical protein